MESAAAGQKAAEPNWRRIGEPGTLPAYGRNQPGFGSWLAPVIKISASMLHGQAAEGAFTVSSSSHAMVRVLVHAILGVRAVLALFGRRADSQGRMDQTAMIAPIGYARVNTAEKVSDRERKMVPHQ
jgi:hypothetical protein